MVTTTTTAPDPTDGVRHRGPCDRPGWSTSSTSVRGWAVAWCLGCGVRRLIRTGGLEDAAGAPR